MDIDLAVSAARRAFDYGPWPKMSGRERGRIMHRFADLLEKHAEELAQLETLDNGKPIFFSRAADVPLSVDFFRYFAGWADKLHGKTIPVDGDFLAYTLLEPIGVVGAIIRARAHALRRAPPSALRARCR
jgi:aldehyde dehydrogenase (NAD+)